ncbi:MAG TPA: exonuclease domain-containing protein, partial [Pseudomonadales bacterium]
MRQIVLDTETTGLSTAQGHRIIEIGCVELVNRRLTGREYHRFLNPEREIDEGAERVHGISIQDLQGQPRFADIAEEFLDFIRGSELVIHNAEFDVGFLDHELALMNHQSPEMIHHATI